MLKDYQFSLQENPLTSGVESYVALSLGLAPSPLLFACFQGGRSGIGAQIAVRMGIDKVVETALSSSSSDKSQLALDIVRSVFSDVNREVYQYGHRMAAGGQISACGLIAVYDGAKISIGRVGNFACYLLRGETLSRFYESDPRTESGGVLDRFIGANSKVLVDLASVSVEEDDVIVLSTFEHSDSFFRIANDVFSQGEQDLGRCAEELCGSAGEGVISLIRVGTPAIQLEEVVFEEFS